ncbi:hypothetical protein PUNSTDRAFT_46835 [Punctularia strigosozonata HHB-11173 SS5]|uniref:uncharacterized protein n=1 Tax=Punctularia strigosozonata (strain HHB-11173) TaxID=741275 RepID=UPI0004416EFD|nr:uncharacterized protein PUNSTDRAFT_46835 [Punctularia strigosozonata HHB-11173 SS5]EIN05468.1 hypothetical protein PUNSTDRAFT_46835 [Punctularia strigosozonata HHB-11173 SS5]
MNFGNIFYRGQSTPATRPMVTGDTDPIAHGQDGYQRISTPAEPKTLRIHGAANWNAPLAHFEGLQALRITDIPHDRRPSSDQLLRILDACASTLQVLRIDVSPPEFPSLTVWLPLLHDLHLGFASGTAALRTLSLISAPHLQALFLEGHRVVRPGAPPVDSTNVFDHLYKSDSSSASASWWTTVPYLSLSSLKTLHLRFVHSAQTELMLVLMSCLRLENFVAEDCSEVMTSNSVHWISNNAQWHADSPRWSVNNSTHWNANSVYWNALDTFRGLRELKITGLYEEEMPSGDQLIGVLSACSDTLEVLRLDGDLSRAERAPRTVLLPRLRHLRIGYSSDIQALRFISLFAAPHVQTLVLEGLEADRQVNSTAVFEALLGAQAVRGETQINGEPKPYVGFSSLKTLHLRSVHASEFYVNAILAQSHRLELNGFIVDGQCSDTVKWAWTKRQTKEKEREKAEQLRAGYL